MLLCQRQLSFFILFYFFLNYANLSTFRLVLFDWFFLFYFIFCLQIIFL